MFFVDDRDRLQQTTTWSVTLSHQNPTNIPEPSLLGVVAIGGLCFGLRKRVNA